MKKSFIALAVLGAMAGTAAADTSVTLYGVFDIGLSYKSVDADGYNGLKGESGDSLTMGSGQSAGSRFGLKGTEELGNGYKVGFVVENGFNTDSGTLGQSGRLFGRESQAYVEGPYGLISMGRVGTLISDCGSFGIGSNLSPFGTGYGSYFAVGNQALVFASTPLRVDNTITYKSPDLNGARIYAQYSFKGDANDDGTEGKTTAQRYGALGVTYQIGGLQITGIFDYIDKAKAASGETPVSAKYGKDTKTFTLGASYDCGYAKSYLAGQYFKDASWIGGATDRSSWGRDLGRYEGVAQAGEGYGDIDGYGLLAGVAVPLGGGDLMAMVGYMDADSDKANKEITRWTAGIGYDYPFSKRTAVYGAAGYLQDRVENHKPSAAEVIVGMRHRF